MDGLYLFGVIFYRQSKFMDWPMMSACVKESRVETTLSIRLGMDGCAKLAYKRRILGYIGIHGDGIHT